MLDNRYKFFISSLLKKTKESQVNWQPTSSQYAFIVTEEDVSITISSDSDEFNREYTSLTIRDKSGKVIDNISIDENEKDYLVLSDLFNEARRKANNVDETIDKLIKKLSNDGEFGEQPAF